MTGVMGELGPHSVVLDQQLQVFRRCELGDLENAGLSLGVREESVYRWEMVSAMVGRRRGGADVPVCRIRVLP